MARALPSALASEPEEQSKPGPSGRLLLRMPKTLHAELTRAAEREGVSLNQFITSALSSIVGLGGEDRGSAPVATADAQRDARHARLVVGALLANAVVIGLVAIVAIVLLLLAWRG
jgi:RNA polymerase sigma-B factor